MSKILAVSDIHIHDYPHYNIKPRFRLNQFISLAQRIVEMATENDCEYLVIAGDVVHRPLVPSHVAHVVHEFFQILSTKFSKDKLLLILGQHDLMTKSQVQNLDDSIIHVLAPYATYVDQEIKNIGGKSVAFSNWRPTQDFSFIKEKVDILFGHVTLSTLFGQEYDDTKFNLGIFGDIHNPISIGNSHSIGVPLPHYISDQQEGTVVLVDTSDLSWKRLKTESSSFKHLKIVYDDSTLEESDLVVRVQRPTATTLSVDHVHRSLNLDEVISEVVSKSNLKDIHSKVSTTIDKSVELPNLDFTINKIEISNFRSISNYTFTPNSGITAVVGNNGSGKSSLMRALDYVFRPPKSSRQLVRNGSNEMSIKATISYGGREHIIDRGVIGSSGYLNYYIDGEEVPANLLSDKNKKLEENLPFIKYFDIMYRYQDAPNILSTYSYSDRISLVNNILGMTIIDRYYASAIREVKQLASQVSKLDTEMVSLDTTINNLSSVDFSPITDQARIKSEHDALSKKLILVYGQLELFKKLAKVDSSISATQDSVNSLVLDKSKIVDEEELNQHINDGNSLILEKFKEFQLLTSKRDAVSSKVKSINLDIDKLNRSKTSVHSVCPSCKRPLDSTDYQSVIDHIDNEISLKKIELSNATAELESATSVVNSSPINDDINYIKRGLSDLKSKIQESILMRRTEETLTNALSKIATLQIERSLHCKDISELGVSETDLIKNIESLNSQRSECSNKLSLIEQLKVFENQLVEATNNKSRVKIELQNIKSALEGLNAYAALFHPTGSVIKSVYLQVANMLSDNQMVVRTVKTLASGETRIDFDVDYLVDGYYIPFSECSGGQKKVMDITFLTKLFNISGKVGIFILDETLRDLDLTALELVSDLLKKSPIRSVLVSTHVESFNFYDNRIHASRDIKSGSTYHVEGS